MSYTNDIKLENLSKRIIKAYRKVKDNEISSMYSTDITELVTKVLDIEIAYAKITDDQSILGLTSFSEYELDVMDEEDNIKPFLLTGKNVLIESALKDSLIVGRKNFTIAHESAHQIINMVAPNYYGVKYRTSPIKYSLSDKQTNKEEIDADKLAAFLLMPQDAIEHFMKIVELEKIRCLNKIFFKKEYQKFCSIAKSLGVSRQALSIRMKKLGYIEMDYLRDPYSLIDIYVD